MYSARDKSKIVHNSTILILFCVESGFCSKSIFPYILHCEVLGFVNWAVALTPHTPTGNFARPNRIEFTQHELKYIQRNFIR